MDEKQIVEKEIEENDKPESISDIRITCSQRCSNWFRILSFMMINGKGSSSPNSARTEPFGPEIIAHRIGAIEIWSRDLTQIIWVFKIFWSFIF